jgi:hypothetical protein
MPFPKNFKEFQAAGYELERPGVCRGCGAEIIWAFTPNGMKMPMDKIGEDQSVTAHWATCPERDSFRKPRRTR